MSGPEQIKKTVREPRIEDAMRTIDVLEQHIKQTGRVDDEPDRLEGIRMQLRGGGLTPREAIIKANDILESRQDYN